MQKFNTHIIQKNETLKSIATLYGLDADTLKLFHNNHCQVKDMILIELTGQKELYIPRIAVADQNKKVQFGRGNSIVFRPERSFSKYGVIVNIETGNSKNELKYETSVRWLKNENNLHFFEIDRTSNLYLNEEEINEIADTLAYKTSKVLYPLQISVDEHGKFRQVENLSVFKERWTTVKEEVYKEFEGDVVDKYCEKIENIIYEPEAISFYLKNDYFIRTLFFGIYQSFGQRFKIEGEESFPVVDNPIEPKYKIHVEVDPVKDEYDLVNISGEGKLNDERKVYDFINESPFSMTIQDHPVMNDNGNFRIQYYLNGETLLPETLYLECSIMLEEEKKISVVITAISE
ncbi:hypothetical protein SAMN05421786_1019 [Chryseobacterium ureilyticum]|uniref:LysM domain-containing protein n=1 Tax=Chryseobacterium ureilyticum TaxID=373668 RepID=A0A1N7JRM9_9FLAO|nr:hypothetical protein [Chryseobacterium ureilyticum]SIS52008.1 hypothetical protein SAMN05421786_1019 [Chryseobacterium ureilyticum]